MISDRFTNAYIGKVKVAISNLKDDIAIINAGAPSGQYEVGRLQGRIAGLQEALSILDETYEEQDI